MNVTLIRYPKSSRDIKNNLGVTKMTEQKLELLGTQIDISEIVRNEVREAIKNLLASTFSTNIVRTGDPVGAVGEQKDKTIPTLKSSDGYKLPVKVVKPTGEVQFRRRKRTQKEMKEAINVVMPKVSAKHPDWSERRQRRLAKNLVRRYKD